MPAGCRAASGSTTLSGGDGRGIHFFMRILFLLSLLLAAVTLRAQRPDGAVKWAFNTLSTAAPGAIVSSPALAADGTVYVGVQVGTTEADASGRVVAVTPAGALKWAATLPDWVDGSPAVSPDGTVYIGSVTEALRRHADGERMGYAPADTSHVPGW